MTIDEELEEDFDVEELDFEKIKNNLHTYKNETICDIVVCHRYLGIYEDLAVLCMTELGSRRANGDSFDFESYIKASLDELPKINVNIPDIGTLFGIKK